MGLFDIFGGGDKPKLPDPVDPRELIDKQAQVNRLDQFTPFGSVTYSGPSRNQLNYTLSPRLQALLATQTGNAETAGGRAGAFLGAASPVTLPDTNALAGSAYDFGMSRLQPQLDRRRKALTDALEQSGNPSYGVDLAPGAVSELQLLGQQENDLYGSLATQSALLAPQLQQLLVGNQATALGANAGAGLSFSQAGLDMIPGLGDFYPPGSIDVTGAYGTAGNINSSRRQLYNQEAGDVFGGVVDLASAALPFFL